MSKPSFHENQHVQQQRLKRSQESRSRPTIGRSIVQTDKETRELLPVLNVVSKPSTSISHQRNQGDVILVNESESDVPSIIPAPSFRAHRGRLQELIRDAGQAQFARHSCVGQYPFEEIYFPEEQSQTDGSSGSTTTPFLTEAALDGLLPQQTAQRATMVIGLGHACSATPQALRSAGPQRTHLQFPKTALACGHDIWAHFAHFQLPQAMQCSEMKRTGFKELEMRTGVWTGLQPARFDGLTAKPVCTGVSSGDEAYVQLELLRSALIQEHLSTWTGHVAQWLLRVEEIHRYCMKQDQKEEIRGSNGKFGFQDEDSHQEGENVNDDGDDTTKQRSFPAFPALVPLRAGIAWAVKTAFRSEDDLETFLAEERLQRAGVTTKQKDTEEPPVVLWSGQDKPIALNVDATGNTRRSLLGNLELRSTIGGLHFNSAMVCAAAERAQQLWRQGVRESITDDSSVDLPSVGGDGSGARGHASVDALLGMQRELPPEVPAWLLHCAAKVDPAQLSLRPSHVQSACRELETELRMAVRRSPAEGLLVATVVSVPPNWIGVPFSLAAMPMSLQEGARVQELPVAVPVGAVANKVDALLQGYYACQLEYSPEQKEEQQEAIETESMSPHHSASSSLHEPAESKPSISTLEQSDPTEETTWRSQTPSRPSRRDQRRLLTKTTELVVPGSGIFATTVREAQQEVADVGKRQAERTLQVDTHEATSRIVRCEQALLSASNAAAKKVLLQVISGMRTQLQPLLVKIQTEHVILAPMPELSSLCKLVWHSLGLCLGWTPGMAVHRAIVQYEPRLAISDGVTIGGVRPGSASRAAISIPENTQEARAQALYNAYDEANQPASRVLISMGGTLLLSAGENPVPKKPQQDILVSQLERFNPATLGTETIIELMNILANPSLKVNTVTSLHPLSGIVLQWIHGAVAAYQQWAGALALLIKQTRRAVAQFEAATAAIASEELHAHDSDLLQRHLQDPNPAMTRATEESLATALRKAAALLPRPGNNTKPSLAEPLTQPRIDHFQLARQRERPHQEKKYK